MTRVFFALLLTSFFAVSLRIDAAAAAPKAAIYQCRDAKGHVKKCKPATLEPLCRVNRTYMKCSKVPHKGGTLHGPGTKK